MKKEYCHNPQEHRAHFILPHFSFHLYFLHVSLLSLPASPSTLNLLHSFTRHLLSLCLWNCSSFASLACAPLEPAHDCIFTTTLFAEVEDFAIFGAHLKRELAKCLPLCEFFWLLANKPELKECYMQKFVGSERMASLQKQIICILRFHLKLPLLERNHNLLHCVSRIYLWLFVDVHLFCHLVKSF